MLCATYWNLADPADSIADLKQSEMGHACEWETSMILRLRPELVKNHQEVPPVTFGNSFLPASRAWVMGDRSQAGHIGIPSAATPQKGEQLFELFADGLVQFIERVIRWDGKSWEG